MESQTRLDMCLEGRESLSVTAFRNKILSSLSSPVHSALNVTDMLRFEVHTRAFLRDFDAARIEVLNSLITSIRYYMLFECPRDGCTIQSLP